MSSNGIGRVLIYGESWRGTIPNCYCRALNRLGYDSIVFDYTKFLPSWRQNNRYLRKLYSIREEKYAEKYLKIINAAFIELAKSFRPSLIIVFRGIRVLPGTIKSLQEMGAKVINCHMGEFFNKRHIRKHSDESFAQYDMHFSSRPHLFAEYRQKGAKRIGFYEYAYDPTTSYAIKNIENNRGKYEVSFVGSWSPYRTGLIKGLGGLDKEIHIWGWGWLASRLLLRCL